MMRHSGSARDPMPNGGYSDGGRQRTSPVAWLVLAGVVVGLGLAAANVTGVLAPMTEHVAGAAGSQG